MYRVVQKEKLIIQNDLFIVLPYSEPLETKLEAKKWMLFRGLQAKCEVMSEDRFRAMCGRPL